MWYLVQVIEYVVVIAVLGQVVPQSMPSWLRVVVFVGVVVGLFLLNYIVIMPKIGRSSRSLSNGDQDLPDA